MNEAEVIEVQRLYPQIYLSCHVDHVRSGSTKWQLSSQDSSILAHLSSHDPMSPSSLAAHLGVVPSTLSAALKRLVKLGYIRTVAEEKDKRKRQIYLTVQGAEAMAGTSVLDRKKVSQMLELLTTAERDLAIRGLSLLARAARNRKEVY